MIVVDTNILSYFLLPTKYSEQADELFKADPEWMAPLLWKSEFRNVLALYIRKEILTFDEILLFQERAESLMSGNEFVIPSAQVLALVKDSNCSAYDCEFISLAKQLDTKLITQDKKLLREFPSIALSISTYLS